MKIELYYYDLDGFKGDRITEIRVASNYGEVEQNEFREGDSIVFYLN
jgi:hypothetical protein